MMIVSYRGISCRVLNSSCQAKVPEVVVLLMLMLMLMLMLLLANGGSTLIRRVWLCDGICWE